MAKRFALVWVATLVFASSARAQSAPSVLDEDTFSHKGQVGINIQGGMGFRALFPYDEGFCGELKDDGSGENKPNCLARSPFALDFHLGYGVLDKLELFVQARIGLERDIGANTSADGPRIFELSPGIRGYIAELGTTRFFSTLQFALDLTDYHIDEADYGVRNTNGFQLDLHKTFGIYLYFGEVVSWRRWLRFEVEAGIGVQARFP
jgi:hypothetical protein